MLRRQISLFLVLLTTGVEWALVPVPALAFNGREHTDVSNMALRIALALAERRCSAKGAADQCLCSLAGSKDVVDLASADAFAGGRTFGHLVALVDQIGGPESYFTSGHANGTLPAQVKDIDWRHIALLRKNPFANLQALHLNEGHFQDEALLRHLLWHQAAISAAREGRLASGLVFEAYADHFFEDFFAPGHIVTPRASSGDMSSIAVHDKFNKQVFLFSVEPSIAKKLVEMIAAVDEVDLTAVPTELVVSGPELDALWEDLDAGHPVAMKGDGFLKERGEQTAFLAFVVALSIQELFESSCGAAQSGAFSSYRWKWPPVDELSVGNAIGHYDLKSSRFRTADAQVIYVPPMNVLVPSISLESFPRGKVQQIRPIVNLETMLLTVFLPEYVNNGKRQSLEPVFFQSPAVLLGGSFAWDQNYQAYGAGWRTIYPIPRLDSQLSLAAGALYLTGRQSWLRPRIGIKAETGLGMLFLNFGVGYDHFIDSAQRLHSGLVLSSGASFVLPRSLLRGRIPRYR